MNNIIDYINAFLKMNALMQDALTGEILTTA